MQKFRFVLLLFSLFFLKPLFPYIAKISAEQNTEKVVFLFYDFHLYIIDGKSEQPTKQFKTFKECLENFLAGDKALFLVEGLNFISYENLLSKDFLDFFDDKFKPNNIDLCCVDLQCNRHWMALCVALSWFHCEQKDRDEKVDESLKKLEVESVSLKSLYKEVIQELEIFDNEPFKILQKQNDFFAKYLFAFKKDISEKFISEILEKFTALIGSSYSKDELLSTPIIKLYASIKDLSLAKKFKSLFENSNNFLNELTNLTAFFKIISSEKFSRIMVFAGAHHVKRIKFFLEKAGFKENEGLASKFQPMLDVK